MKEQTREMTPMQKLLEWNEERKRVNCFGMLTNEQVEAKIKELLPEERKMVEDAYEGGYSDSLKYYTAMEWGDNVEAKTAQDYFTEKYGQ